MVAAADQSEFGGVRVDREVAISADGTRIAYEIRGEGPMVVIVNGAFSTARDVTEFAMALVRAGFAAVAYDRRARGDSGDTKPSAPEREAEDLAAVIGAVGGDVSVIGHSSGAVLALFAASLGVPVRHLFLSEPPFRFGEHEPAGDLAERLQQLVDEGDEATAVSTFQLEGVGLDPALVEQIKQSPIFPGLVPLAQSTVYDAQLVRQVSTPTDGGDGRRPSTRDDRRRWRHVPVPGERREAALRDPPWFGTRGGRRIGWPPRASGSNGEGAGGTAAVTGASPRGEELERVILELLGKRAEGVTICPSEAARAVGGDEWRNEMDAVRSAALRLVDGGSVDITQGGEVVDGSTAKGPIRIRLRG